jgi:dihydrofolate reductase
VTDGIESAVNQAKAAAAGKSVGVHGADTIQQCLNAGLLDEINVDIAAVLLGSGVDSSTTSPARQPSLATRR